MGVAAAQVVVVITRCQVVLKPISSLSCTSLIHHTYSRQPPHRKVRVKVNHHYTTLSVSLAMTLQPTTTHYTLIVIIV